MPHIMPHTMSSIPVVVFKEWQATEKPSRVIEESDWKTMVNIFSEEVRVGGSVLPQYL